MQLLSVAQKSKVFRPVEEGMDSERPDPEDWREWRRMQAWRLKQLGWKQRQIAVALGVTEGAVSRWVATACSEGPAALLARPHLGPAAKLEPDQLRLIPDFLSHGAEAYGFRGAVWTCARVAKVIEEEFGVSYHKGHVSMLLKELRWTPQRPIARAIQRDEQEIEQWRVAVWPRLKDEARRQRRALVFVDESGFYLLPGKVRTDAPEGHTPVLHEWQTRDHLSVMGGVTPTGKIYNPGTSGVAQRAANHRVPQAPDPARQTSPVGGLGRVSHPPP